MWNQCARMSVTRETSWPKASFDNTQCSAHGIHLPAAPAASWYCQRRLIRPLVNPDEHILLKGKHRLARPRGLTVLRLIKN